ncbi:hypothetical protein OG455_07980 [Kitasatospora sp. NBC_01287]|uniref:hypothetical protein n=1 Tax=Kitasatospora sp. NBC_01287 TaxID=2903573 RepID=UPI00225BCE77|nr:hypothetical protein [Kitasatospora sp. NBC_01287]MCX4745460.1 hypothetical protein [Kitasatospora sp. NBC_01287]
MGFSKRWAAALATGSLLALGAPVAAHADGAAPAYRTDLRVLVIDDQGPSVASINAELTSEGIPFTDVVASDHNRPTIDAAFLTATLPDGSTEAKYQAVVLPSVGALGTGTAEANALLSYEQTYHVRQVDANTYPQPAAGLNWPQNPGYIGALDGFTANTTAAGAAGAFDYLKGPVPFEDNNPNVTEAYGFLSTALAAPAAGASFTPLVDVPIPGSTARGSLVGDYQHDGVDELVITFAYNQYQQQWRLLARGVVDWMTQGVHLGFDRDYLSVQVQNVLGTDNRWSTTLKCTAGDAGCNVAAGSADSVPIRLGAADLDAAKAWEAANGITLDLAVDGAGSDAAAAAPGAAGTDPTEADLAANAASFRLVNGTYGSPYLGCVRNTTVVPWACATDGTGAVQWAGQAAITSAVQSNLTWAQAKGLPLNPAELVTAGNSGLAVLPQQSADNPALAPALTALGVTALAANGAAESGSRQVGSATTVPGHPADVFHNAATAAEEADEYNWLYTSTAQGGSGACTAAGATCLAAPLDTTTGFQSTVVPTEAKIALARVLGNDPTPEVFYQGNFAEDRIAYPVLNQVLSSYQGLLNSNTPLVDPRLADIATQEQNQTAWNAALAAGTVTAYQSNGLVTITAPAGVQVPVTAPTGTVQVQQTGTASTAVGSAYAGELSGWLAPGTGQSAVTVQLPAAPAQPAVSTTARTAKAAGTAAARTAVVAGPEAPAGVRTPVPFGPGDTTRLRAARG